MEEEEEQEEKTQIVREEKLKAQESRKADQTWEQKKIMRLEAQALHGSMCSPLKRGKDREVPQGATKSKKKKKRRYQNVGE